MGSWTQGCGIGTESGLEVHIGAALVQRWQLKPQDSGKVSALKGKV